MIQNVKIFSVGAEWTGSSRVFVLVVIGQGGGKDVYSMDDSLPAKRGLSFASG